MWGPPIFSPNAFTPNGDGVNERWRPEGAANVDRVLSLMIFDRWGDLVYQQGDLPLTDARLGWDGTCNGRDMDSAVFVYVVEYALKNGERRFAKGDFTLLR